MSRKTRYNMAMYAVLAVVVTAGVFVLITALGNKLARWGGYADALPLIGLFILFVAGHLILIPRRRRRGRRRDLPTTQAA